MRADTRERATRKENKCKRHVHKQTERERDEDRKRKKHAHLHHDKQTQKFFVYNLPHTQIFYNTDKTPSATTLTSSQQKIEVFRVACQCV